MSAEPEERPVTRQPQGPMRQLSPEQRRRWQSETLTAPRRRYGADARLLFKLEDLVFGMARTLPKFRARELIARTPYQSWEQAAYFKDETIRNGRSRAERLFHTVNADRAEQDNEESSASSSSRSRSAPAASIRTRSGSGSSPSSSPSPCTSNSGCCGCWTRPGTTG